MPLPELPPEEEPVHPAIAAYQAKRARRTCIRCHLEFNSKAESNRICGKCKRSLGDMSMPRVYKIERGREQE